MVIVKSCLLKNFNLRPRPDLICAYYYMLIYNVLVLWKKILLWILAGFKALGIHSYF